MRIGTRNTETKKANRSKCDAHSCSEWGGVQVRNTRDTLTEGRGKERDKLGKTCSISDKKKKKRGEKRERSYTSFPQLVTNSSKRDKAEFLFMSVQGTPIKKKNNQPE